MNKFDKLYNIIMEDLVKEACFSGADFPKHDYLYLTGVINDIINNKKILLNTNGSEEYIFDNLTDTDIADLNQVLHSPSIDKFNMILKRITDNKVWWNKIFKGKYSGQVRANSTINANITELIPALLLFDKNNNYNIDNTFIENLKNIANKYSDKIFLNDNDKAAAESTLANLDLENTQHIIKIKSGIQIFKYIKNLIDKYHYNITHAYWCYRSKPPQVSASNPSDLILKIDTNLPQCYIGFSIKSGTYSEKSQKETSKENKLNSYIIPMLQKHIGDKELELRFYREFNKLISTLDFPNLTITNYNDLSDWTLYKNNPKNKSYLSTIDLNSKIFRTIQNFCIEFFITAFKNNKNFKNIFINSCLGIIPAGSTDLKYFLGFYVIKAIENGVEAKDITPVIPENTEIEIYKQQNSVQSFIIEFKWKEIENGQEINKSLTYVASIRTSHR